MASERANELERVVMLQRLKSDMVDAYVAAHDEVPSSVVESMRSGGVEEYELYVYEDIAVSIMEVADLDEFEAVYGSNPDNRAWEERVGKYKLSGVDPDEMEMPVMERIWSLDEHSD